MTGQVYLIPTVLQEDQKAFEVLPAYILDGIKRCDIFFAENIKTTRRYFKKWWKEMVIDDYQWYAIHKLEDQLRDAFKAHLMAGKNIGIISEAGCPGIADPGQFLVEIAQQAGARVHPMVGPNSILLALMASGMNGQQFQFSGYLPIEKAERRKNDPAAGSGFQKKKLYTNIYRNALSQYATGGRYPYRLPSGHPALHSGGYYLGARVDSIQKTLLVEIRIF